MWIKAVSKAAAMVTKNGLMPVILCSTAQVVRFLVKYLTFRELPELVILSAPEIADGFTVESVGEIRIHDK
jgi:flagellar biosynthesis protein FlhA